MFLLFNPNIITSTWEGTLRYILLYKSIWTDRAYCRRIKWSKRLLLSSHSCVQRMLVIDDVIPNKRPIWAQYISLTLKPPLFQTSETCVRALPFICGSWLTVAAQRRMWRPSFQAAGAETPAWIFQSLWNCWQSALVLCGSFSASLKQAALILHEPSGT